MTRVLLLVSFAMAVAYAAVPNSNIAWNNWKNKHSKTYEAQEEVLRRSVWEDNWATINKHNFEYIFGLHTFTMQINHLGDMTTEEINQMLKKYKTRKQNRNETHASLLDSLMKITDSSLPASVDWRLEGYVTPVKNQGQCGSNWAFSATGCLEGQHFKKTNELVSLSEQQLLDCSTNYNNHGCQGGLMVNAFRYIRDNGGIDSDTCYPYEAANNVCRYKSTCKAATLTGFVDLPSMDEMTLKKAVATIGPISAGIDSSHIGFQLYSSGVYNEPTCSTTLLDHGVLIVGYGTDPTDGDYWIVKNRMDSPATAEDIPPGSSGASGGGNRCFVGGCSNRAKEGFSVYGLPAKTGSVYTGWNTFLTGTRKCLCLYPNMQSWSDKWGESGYIKMSRNKKNQCGIATQASYPIV